METHSNHSLSHQPAGRSGETPGVQTAGVAGQISDHLARHLRPTAAVSLASAPAGEQPPAGEQASPPPAARQPASPNGLSASHHPPGMPVEQHRLGRLTEHLFSTTLLSSWLANTQTTLTEQELLELAERQEHELPAPPTGLPFVLFTLGGHRWGVPLASLREVLPSLPPVTALPFSPLWLHGLINVRSEPVGVVMLSELLLDPISAAPATQRSLGAPVLLAENEGASLALLVEAVSEVIFLEENAIHPVQASETRWLPTFASAHLQAIWTSAVDGAAVLLLDLPRLLTSLFRQLRAREVAYD